MFLGNNIMSPENFFLDVKGRSYIKLQSDHFHQCKAEKTVFYEKTAPKSRACGSTSLKNHGLACSLTFTEQSWIFISPNYIDRPHAVYSHRQPANLKVLVKNASNQMLCILYCHKFGYLINIIYDKSFLIDAHFAFDSLTSPLSSQQYLNLNTRLPFWPINSFIETILDNGVRVYGNAAAVRKIAELVAEYRTIWESQSFAVWKINDSTT